MRESGQGEVEGGEEAGREDEKVGGGEGEGKTVVKGEDDEEGEEREEGEEGEEGGESEEKR